MKPEIKAVGRVCEVSSDGTHLSYSYMINAYHARGLIVLKDAAGLEVGDWVQFRQGKGCWEVVCRYEPIEEDIIRYNSRGI